MHTSLVATVIILLADPAFAILFAAAGIEFVTHLALDAARARLTRRQPALNDPKPRAFWYLLGADQLGHAVVLVALVALVVWAEISIQRRDLTAREG